MTLKFVLRPSYGKQRFYPDCEKSVMLLEKIARRACFVREDLIVLHAMGLDVEIRDESGKSVALMVSKSEIL